MMTDTGQGIATAVDVVVVVIVVIRGGGRRGGPYGYSYLYGLKA